MISFVNKELLNATNVQQFINDFANIVKILQKCFMVNSFSPNFNALRK